jgi:hypothetical protein
MRHGLSLDCPAFEVHEIPDVKQNYGLGVGAFKLSASALVLADLVVEETTRRASDCSDGCAGPGTAYNRANRQA